MLSVFGKDIVERCVQNFQEIVNTEKRMLDELEENQIFAVSKKMSVDLANEYGFNKNKIKIILNSSRFLVRRSREFLGEEGCNEITLGTIGGNFYGKGLPFVCQLISEINKRGYKSKCFIAGCNSQTLSDLKAFLDKEGISDIIDSLILKGKIEVDETFYSQLDCYLCLSLLENHSLSTLEAMSLGIPVMSNCANSVFHDAKLSDPSLNFCELRNLNDVQEMADSLENIFLDCDYRNNLINSGFKAVNQTSWKSVAQEYEKLYFSLS
jgi:glycosyltransferase involved in cell wall biosynthesis